MSTKIPTTMLICTTVVASACSKSNEKLAEDICNLNLCNVSDEDLESYGDDMATYLEECVAEGVEFLEEQEGECGTKTRDFYICVSNLSCSEYEDVLVDEEGPCADQVVAFFECQLDSNPDVDVDEAYPADQYEPDNTEAEASEIVPGESQERTLQDFNDLDYVFFTAEQGKTYTIETTISDDDNTDTELDLYTNEGTLIDGNDDKDDTTYESFLEWTASTSGVYMIKVSTLTSGPYVLSLSEN